MTFWISQGKVATTDRWGRQLYKFLKSIFLRISGTKNRLIFDSNSKEKKRGRIYLFKQYLSSSAINIVPNSD